MRSARVIAFVLPLLLVRAAEARNLECIGGDCGGPGYAVYRSSEPGPLEWNAVCGAWKTDFVVLDDDSWQTRDRTYKRHCPNGTVVYAKSQSVATNLDADFLAFFDRVVLRARSEGTKVLIAEPPRDRLQNWNTSASPFSFARRSNCSTILSRRFRMSRTAVASSTQGLISLMSVASSSAFSGP